MIGSKGGMLAVKAWFNSSESRNIWAIELRRRRFVDNKIAFCYPQNALKIIHGTQKTSRPSVILSRSRKTTTIDSRPFACRNTLNSPLSRSFLIIFLLYVQEYQPQVQKAEEIIVTVV
jgi:hypothetical protein